MIVQPGWQRIARRSDNLRFAIGIDVVFCLEHLFGYTDRDADVDPIRVGMRLVDTVRPEPFLYKTVRFGACRGQIVDVFFGELSILI
jgi:hypothetical protein